MNNKTQNKKVKLSDEERKLRAKLAVKSWEQRNIELVKRRKKEWASKNKEKIKQSYIKWCIKNNIPIYNQIEKPKWLELIQKSKGNKREYRKHYERERRKHDPEYKLKYVLNRRLYKILKNKNIKRDKRSMELLGCTSEELKNHLESQFKKGMSWRNYGKFGWHIDHIIPCASFDLSDSEQQKICFHYTNLQPLWAIENIKKGKRTLP